jgi:hypothetical protein
VLLWSYSGLHALDVTHSSSLIQSVCAYSLEKKARSLLTMLSSNMTLVTL